MIVSLPTRRALACAILAPLLASDPPLRGQQLPGRFFTTAEGLAGDNVFSILQDSRGFLWIGTRTGLSRFDGKVFRYYDTNDGLPGSVVLDILETHDGTLWFATFGWARTPSFP